MGVLLVNGYLEVYKNCCGEVTGDFSDKDKVGRTGTAADEFASLSLCSQREQSGIHCKGGAFSDIFFQYDENLCLEYEVYSPVFCLRLSRRQALISGGSRWTTQSIYVRWRPE